jgi:hypothetical protein
MDVAAGSQQEAVVASPVTTIVTTAPAVLPVPSPADGDRAVVVEVPDDDAPRHGWGQWENWPAPAPEPATGVLVMREDGHVMPRHPTHDAEASSSRAALPAPDGPAARLEQERERTSAPPAHFSEANADQELWQEFRGHGASLKNTLNEALQIHVGPTWRVPRGGFSIGFRSFSSPLSSLPCLHFL